MGLSKAKLSIIDYLNSNEATYADVASAVDITESTARNHVNEIQREGYSVESSFDGQTKVMTMNEQVNEEERSTHIGNNRTDPKLEQERNKMGKTKNMNRHMRKLQERMSRLLEDSEPAVANEGVTVNKGNEDVVIHRSDSHIGDVVENEWGEEIFNTEVAVERENFVTKKTMEMVERQEQAGVEFDTAHLILGGDMVTGENTYSNQQSEIREVLDEQIDRAFEVFMNQVMRLSKRFDSVQVVCQSGNHASFGSDYSNGANADRFLYMMLDKAIRFSEYENITVIRNNSTSFTNFFVRGDKRQYVEDDQGWKYHVRHGDNCLEHIGTSSAKSDWRGWADRHGFDQAYRGHYHQFSVDSIGDNRRVIMTGSSKPPGNFEEQISESGATNAVVHGVSDNHPTTWMYPIDFSEQA